jgi:hypothetical protein
MAMETGYGLRVSPVNPSSMIYETEEERRRREERERMAGVQPQTVQQTVASANQTANQALAQPPIDYNNILNASQTNPGLRTQIRQDQSAPADVKAVARDQERSDLRNQQQQIQATRTMASGDPNKIVGAIKPGDEGSYLRLLALKAFGMTNLALNEERKLGAGQTVETLQSPDGKTRARITFDGFGRPTAGYDQTGRPLGEQELAAYSTFRPDTGAMSGLPQKGELFVDRAGNAFREVFNPQRPTQPDLVPMTPGTAPQGQLIRSTQDYGLAASQAGGRAYGGAVVEQTGQIPVQLPSGATIPPNQGQGAVQTIPAQAAPAAATTPAQPARPAGAPAAPAAPAQAAPAAAPAQAAPSAQVTAVVPGQRPNIVATTPQLNPVVGGGGGAPAARPGAGGIVPPGQYKTQQEINAAAAKEGIQTAQTEPRENIKLNAVAAVEAAKKAKAGNSQLSTLDRVEKYTETHPQFFGAWIGESLRTLRETKTDAEARDAINRTAQAVNIPQGDRPEFQKLMNDLRRLELSGITSSGLSATQLNTERESQRAVGAFAVSITDSAQAARAQAMIARAQIEYDRAFNKYISKANKQLSPSTLQDDFDTKVGDKIFLDLQKKLETTVTKPAGNAQPGGSGFQILNRRPG